MLTLYYRTPLNGVGRAGVHRRAWTIDKVDFPPLADGAPPPTAELVRSCKGAMRDADGKEVSLEELQRHDLREGLRAAFRAVAIEPDGNEAAGNSKVEKEEL
jgi:hypothetical protein